ncbi:hypothetical protein LFL96_00335 [Paraburkholderia sp. D15]|uniref:hypothetical protein n=1 Tax=Paraburkholderia sp. D15 TaxID=2880218 RepID=UPI002479A95D|nr:hypothetical protein [Paraburkholderia sp. D15]WGS49998.1 hypothetical protein LFL96_00335 [Paraburkholderia sp. D15]
MDVKIEKPLHLSFDVIETDEYIPSMRLKISAEIEQFGQNISYQSSLWFTCSSWDGFVSGMNDLDAAGASLVDMNNYFILRFCRSAGVLELSWEIKRSSLDGTTVAVSFGSSIDEDTMAHIKNQIGQFPIWW